MQIWKQERSKNLLVYYSKATVVFYVFFFIIIIIYYNERTWMSSNKLEMAKCEKITDEYVPNKHTEKSVNFPVTIFLGCY